MVLMLPEVETFYQLAYSGDGGRVWVFKGVGEFCALRLEIVREMSSYICLMSWSGAVKTYLYAGRIETSLRGSGSKLSSVVY